MDTEKCVAVDLKLDRNLIDPHFDGYKLSLDPLPLHNVPLQTDVDICKLTDDQYSYQHLKGFGIHNHLISDPWNQHTVLIVDTDWNVQKFAVHLDSNLQPATSVFTIGNAQTQQQTVGRYNVTIDFPASDWAVLSDGCGGLYLIETSDRSSTDEKWQVRHYVGDITDGTPFIIVHSALTTTGTDQHAFHCILQYVEKTDSEASGDEKPKPPFTTILEWHTFTSDGEHDKWTLIRTRRLSGFSSPDCVALDDDCRTVLIACEKPFRFVYDSLKPIETAAAATNGDGDATSENAPPRYTWSQTEDDLTIRFTVRRSIGRNDVSFQCTPDNITLSLSASTDEKDDMSILLEGQTHATIEPDASTWILVEDGMGIELTLTKREKAMWPLVVVGDTSGEMLMDAQQAALIHERLAHLTSDQLNPDPQIDSKPAYNSQQLEECDMFPADNSAMLQFDGETHQLTHKVNLSSNQWLFTVPPCQTDTRRIAICMRHDVDATVWVKQTDTAWRHESTFNAFGYVQASKSERRFTSCAPRFGYAAVCDASRRVYVYRQMAPPVTSLRCRRGGGQTEASVARQQLVSLPTNDAVVGFRVTDDRMFVLAGRMLYVVTMNV